MRYRQHTEVVQPPEDLVRVYLAKTSSYLLLLDDLVQVVREIVSYDVQKLRLPLVRQKTILHL